MRFLVLGLIIFPGLLRADDAEGIRFFESKVRPILIEQCYSCHSEKARKSRGDLKLDSPAAWLKGGSSGPAVVAGKPDDSPLIQAVRRTHKEIAAMPPEKALTREQVADLVEWVRRGAPAPTVAAPTGTARITIADARQRWPYTPLPASVAVPAIDDRWAETPIDRFLLTRLHAQGLKPIGDCEPTTWIRRVTFDLIGLPPTIEEIDAFVQDRSPNARDKVIDRLLDSKHYGERWGRHWLDVVRYADTAGDNSDFPIPQMYLYRNWVIDAFNRDLPYDQFVREQLAGDLMPSTNDRERQQRTIATGYIANARRFGSRVDDYPQHLTIEDTIDNFGRAFLGLSLNCARCHDHKFDPVDMSDYYALYGFFNSTRYPWPGIELEQRQRDLVPLAEADKVREAMKQRDVQNAEFESQFKKLFAEKDKEKDNSKKDALQKQIDEVKKQQKKVVNAPLPFSLAYAVAENKKIGNAAIQIKGDPDKPAGVVPRRFLAILGGQTLPADDRSSGRLALANWLTSPQNPLLARVIVNRVWLHHFGRGLVPTPNDFGKQGTTPTHPELLDYLARDFIENGYSLKKLHRKILLTHAYRLASSGQAAGADRADPNNELLWKFRRQRLDAESIRDSLLAVSGQLDRTIGQEHPFPPMSEWNFTQHKPFRAVYDHKRRSVYLMVQRIQRHPYLAIFDGADTNASTGNRISSTTTLQSLYFLNDPFVHDQARHLSERVLKERPPTEERIPWLHRTLFGRDAQAEEITLGEQFLSELRKLDLKLSGQALYEAYIRSLLRSNEFVYVN